MIEVKESKYQIELTGVSDFETLEKMAIERANKIKCTVIDEKNYKTVEKEMKELLEPAKVLRKISASFKKEGEAKVKEMYGRIKKVENIIRDEVKSKQEEIEIFILEEKKRKIEQKKLETKEFLNELNGEIVQRKAPYKTFENIEFLEEWSVKSVTAIKEEMQRLYNDKALLHRNCTERIKYADMKSKMLKNEYTIENSIDYMSVLGFEIYDLTIQEVDEKLENKASEIAVYEAEQEEKLREKIRIEEEENRRKLELETEKEIKIQQEKLEKEKQKAIDEAIEKERKIQEKKYTEQRELEEKERLEKERLHKIELEKERKIAEEKRIKEEKIAKSKAKKENKYTFSLKIIEASLEQYVLLNEFLEKNKINFERVD